MAPLIEFKNIHKGFPGVQALTDVSFSVAPGDIHALVGENGAGKSTLIKIATGAHRPDAGTILIEGEELRLQSPREAMEAGIRVIYQERHIAEELTVAENIVLGQLPKARYGFLSGSAIKREAQRKLDRLGLHFDLAAPARTLSVADRQLLEIARAVSFHAKLIVMDEPTASLHPGEVEVLFDVIRGLKAEGITVLYISHHLEEIFEIADRVTVLRDGQLVDTAPTEDLDIPGLIRMMFGEQVRMERAEIHGGETDQAGEVAIGVHRVSYGRSLSDVSFDVRYGELVAITGAVGSGTQELARVLSGAETPPEGVVTVDGNETVAASRPRAAAGGVAFIPGDRKRQALMLDRSVADNVLLADYALGRRGTVVQPRRENALARRLCDEQAVKVTDVRQPIRTLSGGNQQKVIIGRWSDVGSQIFVFEDPTAGVDIPSKIEIYRTLRQLVAEGAAVVVISTDLQEIYCLADRVLVMRNGEIAGVLEGAAATEQAVFDMEMMSINDDAEVGA